jgi:hypothetical protein
VNAPLTDREKRVARVNLAWGFVAGVALILLTGLIWKMVT